MGKIKSIHDLLNEYRDRIKNKRDLGTSFERLIKSYLELDPLYKCRFSAVSLWKDWKHCWGPDCGIDIVAEDYAGNFTAIQCKFYSPEYQIKKEDIDSFFTESGRTFNVNGKKKSFVDRIIVSTSDQWSEHAESSLQGQTIEVNRIRVQDLDSSPIDWSHFSLDKPEKLTLKPKKKIRPHQERAVADILKGFKDHDRGKLIMACGGGKTFCSQKLAEKFTKGKGTVLFLVPSISLLSQTLREWTSEADIQFNAFAVCSDTKVGKDSEDISKHDLALPATTDAALLIDGFKSFKGSKPLTVVFSTYQSIKVISSAQKKGFPDFDLIICDEAHRTTGVTLAGEEDSHFVKVHDDSFLSAKKRLYMTATPRIFGDSAKTKANEAGAELCSMDDETLYGPEFHRLGFGEAVSQGLLADYKVLVLAVDEKHISQIFQKKMVNEDGELPVDDIAKIIGCWNGLSKRLIGEEAQNEDPHPMRRAVAFAQKIKDSKHIARMFQAVVSQYITSKEQGDDILRCEVEHVDGTYNVLERNKMLDWLKQDAEGNTCRILSNARCLSEGVDVPALDAVMFLNPRDSMVDVVQSVGRIMRQAPGKKYGYVILPIGIPAGTPPEEALRDNKRYKVVWQVLQALRAHDDRFNAIINQIDLNKTSRPPQIQVIGVGGSPDEESEGDGKGKGKGHGKAAQLTLNLPEIEQWKDAIYARIVIKCGNRLYWEQWANDVAKIAEKHIEHFKKSLAGSKSAHRKTFETFLSGIRKNINPSISEDDAIEMLAQHLITKPVFDALFEHYEFTKKNPVSIALQEVLDELVTSDFKSDLKKLDSFYHSVKMRVQGIKDPEGRQRVITDLYDKFFKVAFPKMAERLGIVYTPVEVVDFIINSVEYVMKTEFNKSLSDKGVHILDPFTGTGTFIVRLLQSGIIKPEDLKRKYKSELHANEIVLLAYYIAAINIEETFHSIQGGDYAPFDGAVLTDTFQLGEPESQGNLIAALEENDERVDKQKKTEISVVISNPPYSAGQDSQNDNNKNLEYSDLDTKIEQTYAAKSSAQLKKSLYDSYIRAIRWASERIGNQGVVGFVTNASFIDSKNMDGLRNSLVEEFSMIYCFNLRGDQRKTGEESRKEGGKIFGSGSRTPVAITILIKEKSSHGPCKLFYYDIGERFSREEKLNIIRDFVSIQNIKWQLLEPNAAGDWINQRNPDFENFMPIGSKADKLSSAIFSVYSLGVVTNRDAWVYSFSKSAVAKNVRRMIDFYNSEMKRYSLAIKDIPKKEYPKIDTFLKVDKKSISWTHNLKVDASRLHLQSFDTSKIVKAAYRPFTKSYLYFDRRLNERVSLIHRLFPTPSHENIIISVIGQVGRKGFSVLAANTIPDLCLLDTSQCFPLYYYEKNEDEKTSKNGGFKKHDSISDAALSKFRSVYGDAHLSKEDIFFYVYGLLHSPSYRERYLNDLKKLLPHIPLAKDFKGFSEAGRKLSNWHTNYESVTPYQLHEEVDKNIKDDKKLYRVTAMKFQKNGKETDRSIILYNQYIKLTGIPSVAYDYVVNGKPAIEWVMDSYCTSVDKDSGIENDPNEWSDDPRYIIDLVKRIVTVSLETNKIVAGLPPLEVLKD